MNARYIAFTRLFRGLKAVVAIVMFVLGTITVVSWQMYKQMKVEAYYQSEFGPEWRTEYEKVFGPGSLSQNNTKLIVACVSIPAVGVLSWVLGRETIGKMSGGRRSSSGRRRHRS